ncbi:hypothetical protein Tco_0127165 [Tanacetum coccineum]
MPRGPLSKWAPLTDVDDDMDITSAMTWQVYEVQGSLYEPMIGVEAMIGWQRVSTRLGVQANDWAAGYEETSSRRGYVSTHGWLKKNIQLAKEAS